MSEYIPDPTEIIESQIDRAVSRQVEIGENCCMECGKEVNYALIPVSLHPASWAVCFECLSPEDQRKYIERIIYDQKENG